MPIPDRHSDQPARFLTQGVTVSIYEEVLLEPLSHDTQDVLHSQILPKIHYHLHEESTRVRVDPCCYFIYWSVRNSQDPFLIDIWQLDDVECYQHAPDNGAPSVSDGPCTLPSGNYLRIQFSTPEPVKMQTIECGFNIEQQLHRTVLLGDQSLDVLEVWQRELVTIAFKNRGDHENPALLDILRKHEYCQHTYPLTIDGRVSTWCTAGQLLPDWTVRSATDAVFQPAVFRPPWVNIFNRRDHSSPPLNSHFMHIQGYGCRLSDFTFEHFLSIFIQAWPRPDVADIFTTHSGKDGLMDHFSFINFIESTTGSGDQTMSGLARCQRPGDRKMKHVTLLLWEAGHLRPKETPTDDLLGRRLEGEQLPRPAVVTLRGAEERPAVRSASQRRLDARRGKGEGCAKASPPRTGGVHREEVLLNTGLEFKEFQQLVDKYECTLAARQQVKLSLPGFYRFLISADYRTTVQSYQERQLDRAAQSPDQGQRVSAGQRRPDHSLSDYLIQSAELVSLWSRAEEGTDKCLSLSTNGVGGRAYCAPAANATLNQTLFCRTVRQLILLGTRALVLEGTTSDHSTTGVRRQLVFVSNEPPGHGKMTDKGRRERSPSQVVSGADQRCSASADLVLKTIAQVAFAITEQPLLLFLRLSAMTPGEQEELASLLHCHLGQWLQLPPLPKYVYASQQKQYSSGIENIAYNAHTKFPPLQIFTNRILLNISFTKQKASGISRSLERNGSFTRQTQVGRSNVQIEANGIGGAREPDILKVFVTNPEGQLKQMVRQDTVSSLGESASPVSQRGKLPSISEGVAGYATGRPCRIVRATSFNVKVRSPLAPSTLSRVNAAPTTCLHPRLGRLVALPTADDIPALAGKLYRQHLRHFRLNTGSEKNRSICSKAFPEDKRHLLQSLIVLFSITFSRMSQDRHQMRKSRLLNHLISIAFAKQKTKHKSTLRDKSIDNNDSGMHKNERTRERDTFTQNMKSKGNRMAGSIRSWFTKRSDSTGKTDAPQSGLLAVRGKLSRRLSGASSCKADQPTTLFSEAHPSQLFAAGMSLVRRLSTASASRSQSQRGSSSSPAEQPTNPMHQSRTKHLLRRLGSQCSGSSKRNKDEEDSLTQEILSKAADERPNRASWTKSEEEVFFARTCGHGRRKVRHSTRPTYSSQSSSCDSRADELSAASSSSSTSSASSRASTSGGSPDRLPNGPVANHSSKVKRQVAAGSPAYRITIQPTRRPVTDTEETSSQQTSPSPTEETSFTSTTSGSDSAGASGSELSSTDSQASRSQASTDSDRSQSPNEHRPPAYAASLRSSVKSKADPPQSDAYQVTRQWLMKAKVTMVPAATLLELLPEPMLTKSLAEFTKHRLIVALADARSADSAIDRELLHSLGCQIVPMRIWVPTWTSQGGQSDACPSVRRQLLVNYPAESAKMTAGGLNTGYLLKPALLREPTDTRRHRYPRLRLARSPSPGDGAGGGSRQKGSCSRCSCCYDPLEGCCSLPPRSLSSVNVGHQQASGGVQSTLESRRPQSWNLSFRLISTPYGEAKKLANGGWQGKQQQEASFFPNPTTFTPPTSRHHDRGRLPRRYQQAANKGRASVTQPTDASQTIASRMSSGHITTSHSLHRELSQTGNLGEGNQWDPVIEVRLRYPVFHGIKSSNTDADECLNPPTNKARLHVRQSNAKPGPQARFPHAFTLNDIKSLNNNIESEFVTVRRRWLSSTSSSSFTSNPDLSHTSATRTCMVDFHEVQPAESVVLELTTPLGLGERSLGEENAHCRLWCAASPLWSTFTGYQHVVLTRSENACQGMPEGESHALLHRRLSSQLGEIFFCKIDMSLNSPASLADIGDLLTRKVSSASSSLNRSESLREGDQRPGARRHPASSAFSPEARVERLVKAGCSLWDISGQGST